MQFMVLGRYSSQGLAGFIQNPSDDRKAAISSMMEKAGVKADMPANFVFKRCRHVLAR